MHEHDDTCTHDAAYYRARHAYYREEVMLADKRKAERRLRASLGDGWFDRIIRRHLDRHTVLDERG